MIAISRCLDSSIWDYHLDRSDEAAQERPVLDLSFAVMWFVYDDATFCAVYWL
jgi:hypothetical protein